MIQLRRCAEINPVTPEFTGRGANARVTFMPLETVWNGGRHDPTREIAGDVQGYSRFRRGDILLPKITPTFEAGRSCVTTDLPHPIGLATTEVHVVRPRCGFDARFLNYLFQTTPFLAEGGTTLEGVGNLRRVPTEWLETYPVPQLSEVAQRAIADFLDRETAKIDALIEKQRALLQGLAGRRLTALRSAVYGVGTRGWPVVPLRRFATMRTGHTPSRQHPEYWLGCNIPWFTLADVWQLREQREWVSETQEKISSLGLANSAAELLPTGTVLLSRTASVGFTGIAKVPLATSQDYWNWICGPHILPQFLRYCFLAMRPDFDALMMGSTHKTIYQGDAAALRVPVPPIDEQARIVALLEEREQRHRLLEGRVHRQLSLLSERRAALITAAVTGQIAIPGVER